MCQKKEDLVRGKEDWQDCGLAHLVQALKLWRDINPCSEESRNDKKDPKKFLTLVQRNMHVCIVMM